MQNNFADFEALNAYLQNKGKGFLLIAHRNCQEYEGMVLVILIRFDVPHLKYGLGLEWMSLGLDFYGDTLQESCAYQFDTLEQLVEYLRVKYAIPVTDIPVKYKFDPSQFPNPINDAVKKPLFETAWQRFQDDFRKGAFLDTSLKLVYSSIADENK